MMQGSHGAQFSISQFVDARCGADLAARTDGEYGGPGRVRDRFQDHQPLLMFV